MSGLSSLEDPLGTWTGYLRDFGLSTFYGASPRIIFTPSGNAIRGGNILATRRIISVPDVDGSFSVKLIPSDSVIPERYYTMRIEWLDSNAFGPDAGYIGVDFPDMKIRPMGEGDGVLTDVIDPGGANPLIIWSGPTPPPSGHPNMWWLNTATQDLFVWEA